MALSHYVLIPGVDGSCGIVLPCISQVESTKLTSYALPEIIEEIIMGNN